MIRLFVGYEKHEVHGLHVFTHSVWERASKPVAITAIGAEGMAVGSNAFTLSRFLVAEMCGFAGHAIFCDGSDMLMLSDVLELDALYDPRYAVQVVKHPAYTSQHEVKYVGTELECAQSNYARKNWASVMLINCAHAAWRNVGRGFALLDYLQFKFLDDAVIGELPREWNVLVDEAQDDAGAKLLHWTAGIPAFAHYKNARRSQDWFRAFAAATGMAPASARGIDQ